MLKWDVLLMAFTWWTGVFAFRRLCEVWSTSEIQSRVGVAAMSEYYLWLKLVSESLEFGISEKKNEIIEIFFRSWPSFGFRGKMGCPGHSLIMLLVWQNLFEGIQINLAGYEQSRLMITPQGWTEWRQTKRQMETFDWSLAEASDYLFLWAGIQRCHCSVDEF